MSKAKLATAWLDGCSGCHMSLLDMDEKLIDVAKLVDVVYSPTVDLKEFPPDVAVTLIEGAVSSEHDVEKLKMIRARTKILGALGDCAVTGNVPSMRNPFEVPALLDRAYQENASLRPGHPTQTIPALCPKVRPLHEVVKVDVFVPGCPPPPEAIFFVVSELLAGRIPDPGQLTRFGK